MSNAPGVAAKLMTVKETADILRCSPKHVRQLINSDKLRAIRTGASARSDRVHPDDVQVFINTRRSQACQSISVETFGGLKSRSAVALLDGPLKPPARGKRKRSNVSSTSTPTTATVTPISTL